MFNKVTKTFQYGQHTVTLETGEIARQASGAVLVSIEDIGSLSAFLVSDSAKSLTGGTIHIDGGYNILG